MRRCQDSEHAIQACKTTQYINNIKGPPFFSFGRTHLIPAREHHAFNHGRTACWGRESVSLRHLEPHTAVVPAIVRLGALGEDLKEDYTKAPHVTRRGEFAVFKDFRSSPSHLEEKKKRKHQEGTVRKRELAIFKVSAFKHNHLLFKVKQSLPLSGCSCSRRKTLQASCGTSRSRRFCRQIQSSEERFLPVCVCVCVCVNIKKKENGSIDRKGKAMTKHNRQKGKRGESND